MTGAIDVIRCEITKYRGLAAFLALKYINMGFPMYVTLRNIPIENLSTVKGLSDPPVFTTQRTPESPSHRIPMESKSDSLRSLPMRSHSSTLVEDEGMIGYRIGITM